MQRWPNDRIDRNIARLLFTFTFALETSSDWVIIVYVAAAHWLIQLSLSIVNCASAPIVISKIMLLLIGVISSRRLSEADARSDTYRLF